MNLLIRTPGSGVLIKSSHKFVFRSFIYFCIRSVDSRVSFDSLPWTWIPGLSFPTEYSPRNATFFSYFGSVLGGNGGLGSSTLGSRSRPWEGGMLRLLSVPQPPPTLSRRQRVNHIQEILPFTNKQRPPVPTPLYLLFLWHQGVIGTPQPRSCGSLWFRYLRVQGLYFYYVS